ncbi:outer membrane beta-barrel protein [Vibrio paucivorans]|uniref:Porin family protein n=1 Tax=Vibrio paucivorans TaxID=2829489 RepID=A0A9X3HTT1_9VIBR|nr:outer membrane beta-barrel protein [Vibrio paucivorans]MCW8336130.1 porin family protein [Vibrio paucivorans]
MQLFRFCLLASVLASPSLALASKTSDYVYVGYQNARVSDNGFQDYFEGAYNNQGSKDLYGVFLGGNHALNNGWFVTADLEATTRSSTSVSDFSFGAGHSFSTSESLELYIHTGVNWVSAERRSSCRNDDFLGACDREVTNNKDTAMYGELGGVYYLNDRWSMHPSNSYSDVYSNGINKLNVGNVFRLSSWFSLEANYGYTYSKHLKQNNIQLGGRFSFD